MKQYLVFFKLQFITQLQYRMAALAGISTQFFFGLVFILVYLAFYESNNTNVPMNLKELISYLWLNQAFLSLMYVYYKDRDFLQMLKDGSIAYELCRPQNLYIKWFTKILSTKLANVSLRCIPVLIISILLPSPYNLSLPISFEAFCMFCFSMFVGAILITAIVTLYHIITLFTIDEKGILSVLMVIADLFAGGIVPIPFLPTVLKRLSHYLPFEYIFDLPYRIYSGNINIYDALFGIFVQLLWLIIITVVGYLLTNRALKRVAVQGG